MSPLLLSTHSHDPNRIRPEFGCQSRAAIGGADCFQPKIACDRSYCLPQRDGDQRKNRSWMGSTSITTTTYGT